MMEATDAIRSRRTCKSFDGQPLMREELEELFELARWAPNHKLTQPWRFRVLGANSQEALRQAAATVALESAPDGADAEKIAAVAAKKLDRAPTLVAVSCVRNADPVLEAEDFAATAIAAYIVLLAAHARGLAGYWRSPAVLRDNRGTAALAIGPEEDVLGLLHLGHAQGEPPAAAPRRTTEAFVSYLD
jgi:nitroreductase